MKAAYLVFRWAISTKWFWYFAFMFMVQVWGCTKTKTVIEFVDVPDIKLQNMAFNEWAVTATRHSASQRWANQSGIHIVYTVYNGNDVPVNIEAECGYFIARFWSEDPNIVHEFGEIRGDSAGTILTESVDFRNLEPGLEMESLSAFGSGFLSGFVQVNWDTNIMSVWPYMKFKIKDETVILKSRTFKVRSK